MIQADAPTMVQQSPSIIYGLLVVGIGQLAVLVGQFLTARGARLRAVAEAAAATDAAKVAAQINAEALAVAAALVDERAVRERQWLIEDRKALAVELATRNAELAAKVQMTAEALAAKQVVDLANVALLGRQHAAELAAVVRNDQTVLGAHVTDATNLADRAVAEISGLIKANTELTKEVGVKAEAAYTEANHVNQKIEDLNRALLRDSDKSVGQMQKIDDTTMRIEDKQDAKQ